MLKEIINAYYQHGINCGLSVELAEKYSKDMTKSDKYTLTESIEEFRSLPLSDKLNCLAKDLLAEGWAGNDLEMLLVDYLDTENATLDKSYYE